MLALIVIFAAHIRRIILRRGRADVEPLLRRELHLGGDQQIELLPCEHYLAGDKMRYGAVPSLRPLEQKLRVKEE